MTTDEKTSAEPKPVSRTQNIIVAILGIVILGFCIFGFGSKFIEFVHLVTGDDVAMSEGIFAVAPMVNYLLASAGFLCLLGWAAAHGMFHNIEGPKHTMLDIEARLDANRDDTKYCDSVIRKERPVP